MLLAHPGEDGASEAEDGVDGLDGVDGSDGVDGLDVAYCCDERYLAPCLVSAWSLRRSGDVDVRLHLVFRGDAALGKRAAAALRGLFSRGVRLYSPRGSWGALYAPLSPGIAESTMDRLALPELRVRKLLYLDCDTVVLRSLRAACALEPAGLASCACAGSAGVLLMAPQRLRAEGFGERAAALLDEAPCDDQTLLCRLCGAAGGLPPSWNGDGDDATVRHYAGRSKPWQRGGDAPWHEALRGALEHPALGPLLTEALQFTPGWSDASACATARRRER